MLNSQFKGQNKTQSELSVGSCARPDLSEQNIPKSSPASETNMHISIILAAAHTNTSPRCTLRVGDPFRAIKFIFPLQTDNLIYGTRVELRSGREKKRNHSIITFNGFIPLPQQCCHTGMTPMCCLVSGSACFMWMMEAWGRLVSKGAPCVGGESTGCLMFSSYIRYSEDGYMFSGCEKRVAHKCSHLKQNMWPADIKTEQHHFTIKDEREQKPINAHITLCRLGKNEAGIWAEYFLQYILLFTGRTKTESVFCLDPF